MSKEIMQQALDALTAARPACFAPVTTQAVDSAIDALRAAVAAPSVPASQWAACSERMPDDDIEVLAWVADGFFDGHCYIVSRAGDWFVDDDARTVSGVTHWMDLPEAPEINAALAKEPK